jgi:hypothetical protein
MDTDEIRAQLQRRRPPLDVDREWAALERRLRARRRVGQVTTVAGVVVAVGVVAAAVAVFGGGRSGVRVDTDGTAPPAAPTESVAPGPAGTPDSWRSIAAGPLSPRDNASAAWTGTEVVIVGGTEAPVCRAAEPSACRYIDARLGDGAAYDPATDTWRKIASPPVAFEGAPALWTGDEVLVFTAHASSDRQVLGYDPASDEWRELAPPPTDADLFHPPVWAGGVAVFATGETGDGTGDWAYDPAADAWTELPADPIGCASGREAVAAGGRMVLAGRACADGGDPARYRAAAYDPATGDWSRLPALHLTGEAHVWYTLGSVAVDPPADLGDLQWEAVPPASGPHPDVGAATGYFGTAGPWVVGAGRMYAPATGAWRTIPAGPHRAFSNIAVWTGSELIQWSGVDAGYGDYARGGAAYTPPVP